MQISYFPVQIVMQCVELAHTVDLNLLGRLAKKYYIQYNSLINIGLPF